MIDVSILNVGTVGVFSFVPPYDRYVRDLFNYNTSEIKLEILSIISMKDYIFNTHRDPFTDIYNLVSIPEVEYKQDLKDNVSIITFQHIDSEGRDVMFRIPATYVEGISDPTNVEYVGRVIQISLPPLPFNTSIRHIFSDLEDMISGRLGVSCEANEFAVSETILLDPDDHESRETIRKNSITINKSNEVKLRETTEELDAIKEALIKNKIILGK